MKTKSSKHTHGPWHVGGPVKNSPKHALIGIGNGATHVGYVSVTPANASEAGFNARLIAAAPELLYALANCEIVLRTWNHEATTSRKGYENSDFWMVTCKAINEASAAIKKASAK